MSDTSTVSEDAAGPAQPQEYPNEYPNVGDRREVAEKDSKSRAKEKVFAQPFGQGKTEGLGSPGAAGEARTSAEPVDLDAGPTKSLPLA